MDESAGALMPSALPDRIGRLADICYNLWWSWDPEAGRLLAAMAPDVWERSAHNPISALRDLDAGRLQQLAGDGEFTSLYDKVIQRFDNYMGSSATAWFPTTHSGSRLQVAYFCAEYGFHPSLPIYSGGLGILAGDHCKTASDLALPFVAVGLWYTQGYFKQIIDHGGQQIAAPDHVDQADAPLRFSGLNGSDLVVAVPCAGRTVYARVWRLQVGRVPVYLLDVDIPQNSDADRALCSRLYGGDKETRIAQEAILGVGGVMALRALGLAPTCWHMNEGHAGFTALERLREQVAAGADFEQARARVAAETLFTTHTPVPAGNEVFANDLVLRYFPQLPGGLGLDVGSFLALGHEAQAPDGYFAMTPLALRLSQRANGVSKLHGAVARAMWTKQFGDRPSEEVPITSITNGVHSPTWIAPDLNALLARYLGRDWLSQVDNSAMWERLALVPDDELWQVHMALKQRLFARASVRQPAIANLRPDVLTIGFARRFATYKRATLFFRDQDRARHILTREDRPVQLVFAGKAHPADGGGQNLIKLLDSFAHGDDMARHVVLVPGYDIALARRLTQGVDVWLNNPERPQEASGTSGQKAALNGIPNCSIRDGWWDEAYNGANGWAFGGETGNDVVDSQQLYEVLEQQVIPAYYDRQPNQTPSRWVAVMKEAMRTCAPAFSSQRMLKEYTDRLYLQPTED